MKAKPRFRERPSWRSACGCARCLKRSARRSRRFLLAKRLLPWWQAWLPSTSLVALHQGTLLAMSADGHSPGEPDMARAYVRLMGAELTTTKEREGQEESSILTSALKHIYEALSILDSKAGALLSVNSLYCAIVTFVVSSGQGPWWPSSLSSPWLGTLLVVASLLCVGLSSHCLLRVIWTRWSEIEDRQDSWVHTTSLLRVRDRRTVLYRLAHTCSRAAFLVGLALVCLVLLESWYATGLAVAIFMFFAWSTTRRPRAAHVPQIRRLAHRLWQEQGGNREGGATENWLQAEREILSRPVAQRTLTALRRAPLRRLLSARWGGLRRRVWPTRSDATD